MITYEKLWQTMKAKGITKYALIKKHGISPGQITRLKRNEGVSVNTIDKFCTILGCKVEDIMEYIEEAK
jgi:DNA-binding Xre family transcriptional regulator